MAIIVARLSTAARASPGHGQPAGHAAGPADTPASARQSAAVQRVYPSARGGNMALPLPGWIRYSIWAWNDREQCMVAPLWQAGHR